MTVRHVLRDALLREEGAAPEVDSLALLSRAVRVATAGGADPVTRALAVETRESMTDDEAMALLRSRFGHR